MVVRRREGKRLAAAAHVLIRRLGECGLRNDRAGGRNQMQSWETPRLRDPRSLPVGAKSAAVAVWPCLVRDSELIRKP